VREKGFCHQANRWNVLEKEEEGGRGGCGRFTERRGNCFKEYEQGGGVWRRVLPKYQWEGSKNPLERGPRGGIEINSRSLRKR